MLKIQHYEPDFVKSIGETDVGGLTDEIKASLMHIKKKNGFNVYTQSNTVPNFNGGKGFVKKDNPNYNQVVASNPPIVPNTPSTGNAWRDGQSQPQRKVIGGTGNPKTKEVYLLLNKISDSNLQVITKQIINLLRSSEDSQDELLGCMIQRLFQSAMMQVHFCRIYANLCQTILVEMDSQAVQSLLDQKINSQINGLQDYRKECDTDNYDNYCDDMVWKNRHIGFYQFITELYNHRTLNFQQFINIVDGIKTMVAEEDLKFKTEILVESLCRIYKSIYGSTRITPLEKERVQSVGKALLVDFKDKMNCRSRFILEDALADKF